MARSRQQQLAAGRGGPQLSVLRDTCVGSSCTLMCSELSTSLASKVALRVALYGRLHDVVGAQNSVLYFL